jgi:hypothetical protein
LTVIVAAKPECIPSSNAANNPAIGSAARVHATLQIDRARHALAALVVCAATLGFVVIAIPLSRLALRHLKIARSCQLPRHRCGLVWHAGTRW